MRASFIVSSHLAQCSLLVIMIFTLLLLMSLFLLHDAFVQLPSNSKLIRYKSLKDPIKIIDRPNQILMVPSPVDNIEKDRRGIEVSATAGSFFFTLFYFKSLWWSAVLLFLSHYVVQKSSLFGNTLRAFGFIVYTVTIFITDTYKTLKNKIGDDKTREYFENIEESYDSWRINERVQKIFDFTDFSIDRLNDIFDSARKET